MDEERQSAEPTVFIVNDDVSVRKSMERLVRSMGFRPETFASAEEFLARERYVGVGCIILDIQLPGLSGVDLQDKLNSAGYSMPIIFVTGHGDIPLGVSAMKKGAVDFLPKPVDDQDLLQAVAKAIKRDRKTRIAREARELLKLLTPREQEVLGYVLFGMMNKQIALELNISEKTVKIHRGNVMKKLHAQSVVDLIRLAEKAGIQLPGKELP
jgi:FixJ family two-component response regulator